MMQPKKIETEGKKREIEYNLMLKLAIMLMFFGFVVMLAEFYKGEAPQIEDALMGGLLVMMGFVMILAMGVNSAVRRVRKLEGKPALHQKSDKADMTALITMMSVGIFVIVTVNHLEGLGREIYAYLGAVFTMAPVAWITFRKREGQKAQEAENRPRDLGSGDEVGE